MFFSGYYTGDVDTTVVTLKILVNGIAQNRQVAALQNYAGDLVQPMLITGIFSLLAGASVQIVMYTTSNNIVTINTSTYPQDAGTIYNIKSIF